MRKMFPKIAYNHKILILGVVLLFCVLIITFTNTLSVTTSSSIWDGSIATSFNEGTGTYDDPYIISNGGEFVYFLTQMNEEGMFTSEIEITNNIDFNGADLSTYTTNLNTFAGTINGNGYTLSNFALNNPKNDINAYSLFGNLNNATIEKISFENVTINATGDNNISLIANNITNTTIENINILNLNIYRESNTLGVIFNNDLGNNVIKNINVDVTSNEGYIVTNNYLNSNISNIIYKSNSLSIINTETELTNIYSYIITDTVEFTNKTNNEILEILNFENTVTWDITGININMISADSSFMDNIVLLALNDNIVEHDSGISGTNVYVNDLTADYNYYMGLNYTKSLDGKLPSTENKNYYNENNLVRVQINYNGTDVTNTYTGTVSISETQNKFVYYKYYSVNTNGTLDTSDDYINIELIDNVFTNRPTDMAFNGWITTYPNATVSLDTDTYLRYVKVPITYTNDNPNDIVLDMYSSWIEASIGYANGSFNSAFNNLKTQTMQSITNGSSLSRAEAGYFKQVSLYNGQSLIGYYNSNGAIQKSGTCSGTCTYYELIQYSEQNNTPKLMDDSTYYYLPTRDTNIVVVTAQTQNSYTNYNSSKPFTMTSVYNGTDYRSSAYWRPNTAINLNSDLTIENIRVYSSTTQTTSNSSPTLSGDSSSIYGGWYNLKIGRGLTQNGTNVNFKSFTGGKSSSTGSSSSITEYTLRVESGIYRSGALATGYNNQQSNNNNYYIHGYGIYGTDYDRVSNNNDSLIINYCVSGSYSGYIYGTGYDDISLNQTIKSGKFGSNKNDYAAGVYSGGRSYGKQYTARAITIEGGYIYNLIGGPLTPTERTSYNDTYMYIKGGEIDNVVGGAGISETYGNRIIQVTGGKINYSVFGGSNGYLGSGSQGLLTGTPYVYIGGNAVIGDDTLIANNTKLYDSIESGSVFGIGNGKSGTSSIGSADNSNIIIEGNAIIKQNVYGGGNYGATGINSSSSTNTTTIKVKGGTINGAIYGGGNNNGAGSTSKTSTINITVDNGTINNIYGGSRTNGTIYGNVNLNITNGNINNIYGGGEGGYSSTSSTGTYVSNNINLTIGNDTTGPTINGNVYGGSAYGTVSATSSTASANSNEVNITVNKGTITGSVFGGAKGSDTYTPYVKGNIKVIVNDGLIGYVYGGFDQAGIPEGTSNVYLNGGTIGSVFGGGNLTSMTESNVHEQGSTVNYLYGGSNNSGIVSTSNVNMTSGTVGYVYGGNNLGGSTTTANTTIDGGTINYAIYGGGNNAGTTTNNLVLNSTNNTIPLVVGGDKSASSTTTNVTTKINATVLYGASDQEGTVDQTNITMSEGAIPLIYGGGNNAPTNNTSITITGGDINTIFGGGNEGITGNTVLNIKNVKGNVVYGGGNNASTTSTDLTLESSEFTYVYGGGNLGSVTSTNAHIKSGNILEVYGGGNKATVEETNIDITGGMMGYAYGGGNEGAADVTNILVNGGSAVMQYIFGGGKSANAITTNVEVLSGSIGNVYGGSNSSGTVGETNINIGENNAGAATSNPVELNIDYTIEDAAWRVQNYEHKYKYAVTVNVSIVNNTDNTLTNYSGSIIVPLSTLYSNYSGTELRELNGEYSFSEVDKWYGTHAVNPHSNYEFSFVILTDSDAKEFICNTSINGTDSSGNNYDAYSGSDVKIVYGGNNAGGTTGNANITVNKGKLDTIYGGGNQAIVTGNTTLEITDSTVTSSIYGGGNQGNVNGNTSLSIESSTINENIFGGGNNGVVKGNTNVLLEGAKINMSAYAGGNGSTATVEGNTTITAGGKTVIGLTTCDNKSTCSIFGGGNAATTGASSTNNSKAIVNIAGALIYGNLYGGANTSVVYGTTKVNVGASYTPTGIITKDNIYINGTIFGGGEANASGSENYDYSFISVTNGIDVEIDGNNYDGFEISGSIFGSGNASSTTGPSVINIYNYGQTKYPKKNISIQRTDVLTLDNSSIELSGATDRTNEYKTTLFTLSRVTVLNLKDSSTLYLEENANLLEEFNSLNADNTYATVNITEGSITRSTNNRLYLRDGVNLNIELNEQNTEYGIVNGMTFLGMFKRNNNGAPSTGTYDNYNFGDTASNISAVFETGSYVMGYHKANHNIEVDGFYTNKVDEDTNTINMIYVEPTPSNATYYRWLVGENIIQYNIDLVASKYSTLGTAELNLYDFYKENTSINIIGFDSSELKSGNSLIEKSEVPRVAESSDIADTTMALTMQPGNSGWLVDGETHFVSDERLYTGTTEYVGENSTKVPSLLFYLNHSKNLSSSGDMGNVKIVLMAVTKIDDLKNEITRLVINVNLSRVLYTTNDYEASLTPGRKYEMFKSTTTSITSNSSFSAYYSLFVEDQNVYQWNYKRALITNNVLPLNTKITMIDLSGDQPAYYYHIIDSTDVARATSQISTDREAMYELSLFSKMGTNDQYNYYANGNNNNLYYDSTNNISSEEFIFIVDFKDATITSNMLSNTITLELLTASNETKIGCLGIEQADMKYDVYKTDETPLYVNGTSSSNTIYPGDEFTLDITTTYDLINVDSKVVYDTEYFEHQMGIKLSIINPQGQVVSGTSLLGLYYEIDGVEYHPNIDGTTRIKISEKIGDVEKWIRVHTGQSNMSSGNYKLRVEAFGSVDGIFYGLNTLSYTDIPLTIINELYGMDIETTNSQMIINSITGLTLEGTNQITYNISYESGLDNPNIHIKLYRRDYSSTYSTNYIPVDLSDYVKNSLMSTSKEKEYLIVNNPREETTLRLLMKDHLLKGTYKVQFILCDNDAEIGTIDKYIVIK